MRRLRNIAMHDYQESVTIGQTQHWQTDRQTSDKVIPMCRYASQATQKVLCNLNIKHINIRSMLNEDYKHMQQYIQYYFKYYLVNSLHRKVECHEFTHRNQSCLKNKMCLWRTDAPAATTLLGLVVLRICVASAIFQPYHNLKGGDNQSQKL